MQRAFILWNRGHTARTRATHSCETVPLNNVQQKENWPSKIVAYMYRDCRRRCWSVAGVSAPSSTDGAHQVTCACHLSAPRFWGRAARDALAGSKPAHLREDSADWRVECGERCETPWAHKVAHLRKVARDSQIAYPTRSAHHAQRPCWGSQLMKMKLGRPSASETEFYGLPSRGATSVSSAT